MPISQKYGTGDFKISFCLFEKKGDMMRMIKVFSAYQIYFFKTEAEIPTCFANSEYFINLPV